MKTIELKTSSLDQVITKIITNLVILKPQHWIPLVKLCQETISQGNPNVCLYFKDLLPAILTRLKDNDKKVTVDGMYVPCKEYYTRVIGDVLNMNWPVTMLSSIAVMFKNIELTKEQMTKLLAKLCENLRNMDPSNVPGLAHQMFMLCKCSQLIIIPLLALNKYFYLHLYKDSFTELNSEMSDYDSIDRAPAENVQHAEETVIFHFQTVTKYTQIEKDLLAGFKNLTYTPQYILTPFLLAAILSVVKVSSHDGKIIYTQSVMVPFLRQVIKINETTKEIAKNVAWARILGENFLVPDLQKTLDLLILNNKNGKETSAEGLVALAFALLKSKNTEKLNSFGAKFLNSFVDKRATQFMSGIIKNLTESLLSEQDKPQIVECFTYICLQHRTLVSQQEGCIKSLIDELLNVTDETALVFMSVISPLAHISITLREYFIEILRKAFYHNQTSSRILSVFGFCKFLEKLGPNSRRTGIPSGLTQTCFISGNSTISQASISHTNNPQRHFDVVVLEVIGVLQK
jgi:Fanconi anemia group I protein